MVEGRDMGLGTRRASPWGDSLGSVQWDGTHHCLLGHSPWSAWFAQETECASKEAFLSYSTTILRTSVMSEPTENKLSRGKVCISAMAFPLLLRSISVQPQHFWCTE